MHVVMWHIISTFLSLMILPTDAKPTPSDKMATKST